MADLPSILGGMAQGFTDFGKGLVDMFGTGGAAIGDLVDSIRTGKVTTKNQDDFRKWLYQTDSVEDAAAKGLGTALNGVQTIIDYIPGVGAVTKNPLFNAGQGALGGLADEFKMYGKDYDLARAGERAAVSAGGALAASGLGDALKQSANPLLSSGTVQGLARGATGGAIGAGGYAAIDGGDVLQSALQGAGTGALIGGGTGLLQDFRPAKTYEMPLTEEEKALRVKTIDDQIANLDTSTPDGAARLNELTRARAVYDTAPENIQRLYHQTSANSFEEFSPEKRASGVMDQGTPTGIFLKENNNDIGLPGKNQLQFDVKMENPYQVDSRDALANYARSRSKTYADLYDQAVELDKKSADVYNEFTNKLDDVYKKYYYEQDATKKAALKKDVDYLIKNIKSLSEEKASEYRRQGADVARKAQDELNRVLREDGYDSVILANDEGSFGRKIKSYIALSPYEQMAEIKKMPLESTLSASENAINNAPEIMQSVDPQYKRIYHGTNATFTDFDEKLPSVWFTDNADDIANTGLSNRGGKLNIMERDLPSNLKLADWDLADKYTKQQLIDRGYDGIAYDGSGTSGNDTYYEIFKPNETLKKVNKDIQASYYDGYDSYGNRGYASDVLSVGNKDVAPIDPATLPEDYNFYKKVTDMNKAKYGYAYDAVMEETGKSAQKITKADLENYLKDNYPDYYDTDKKYTKWELEKDITSAIEDSLVDEGYENGADLSALVHNRYPRAGIKDIYVDHSGKTGALDRELSKRLGIGESTSPLMDVLNNDSGAAAGDVNGRFLGVKHDSWMGGNAEDKLSTMGHERLHLIQNVSNGFDYEQVQPVYKELSEKLSKAMLTDDELTKVHGKNFGRGHDLDYYKRPVEQEARMLEAYLYDKGYTKGRPYRVEEFKDKMNIITPAFDKFFDKLRDLSKRGVALPALAALFGGGAYMASQEKDKEEVK